MTQVNFRIDDDIKNNAEALLKEMGLNMSTAITNQWSLHPFVLSLLISFCSRVAMIVKC